MMMISPPLRSLSLLLLLLLLLATVSTGQISAAVVGEEEATKPTKFNVTAIGARNNASTLECWQLAEPLLDSTVPGQAGGASLNLGAVSRINYIIVPADLAGSLRNAPAIQWVMFISGLVRISLPDDNSTITGESSVYITGGEFGLIFASDVRGTSERGHRTQYPGLTETVALGIPTADGQIPEHEVLHMGPCTTGETTGIRAFA